MSSSGSTSNNGTRALSSSTTTTTKHNKNKKDDDPMATTTTTTKTSAMTTSTSTRTTACKVSRISSCFILKIMIGIWFLGLFLVVLYTGYCIYDKHFYTQDFTKFVSEGRIHTNTTFIRREMPITYYKIGELDKVLPPGNWLSSPHYPNGMHVFRLEEQGRRQHDGTAEGDDDTSTTTSATTTQQSYDIDINQIRSSMRLQEINPNCLNQHGWALCPETGCIRADGLLSGTAEGILNGTNKNYFGSFTEINQTVVDYLEQKMKLSFQLDRGKFEQSFISNFDHDIITSPLHANPVTHSMSIQYIGRKTWIFFTAEDYVNKYGFYSTSVNGPFMPLQAPTSKVMYYWSYKSKPGDIFFFPSNYGHLVKTHKGPNLMLNYRKLFPKQMLLRYKEVIHALYNMAFYNIPIQGTENVGPDGKQYQYTQQDEKKKMMKKKNVKGAQVAAGMAVILQDYEREMSNLVCQDDSETNMDRILAKLLNHAADTVP